MESHFNKGVLDTDTDKHVSTFSPFELFVKRTASKSWDWVALTRNKAISIHFIISHPNFPWDFNYLSNVVPISIVKRLITKKWNWSSLTAKATFDELRENPTLPWDGFTLSSRDSSILNAIFEHNVSELISLLDFRILSQNSLGISERNVAIPHDFLNPNASAPKAPFIKAPPPSSPTKVSSDEKDSATVPITAVAGAIASHLPNIEAQPIHEEDAMMAL